MISFVEWTELMGRFPLLLRHHHPRIRLHPTPPASFGWQNFNGQFGKAFLFDLVVNIKLGDPQDRRMTTGLHTVRDIECVKCGQCLGWKYVSAGLRLGEGKADGRMDGRMLMACTS